MNYSINKTINRCGLPLVVTSTSPHLCFLVDTGASNNIIFSYVLDAVNVEYTKLDDVNSLMGIDGNPVNVTQIEASVSFDNKTATSIFSVLDANTTIAKIQKECGVQLHGILGIPFLLENEWVLDFKQLTISN